MKIVLNLLTVGAILALAAGSSLLAARGESLAAFGAPSAAAALGTPFGAPSAAAALGTPFNGRCIPAPPQRGCRVGDPGAGCVAPRSNTPGIATPPRKIRAAGAPVFSVVAPCRWGGAPNAAAALGTPGRLARLGATPDFSPRAVYESHYNRRRSSRPEGCRRNVNTLLAARGSGRSVRPRRWRSTSG